jgi:pilus assembly protein Flp/PilA
MLYICNFIRDADIIVNVQSRFFWEGGALMMFNPRERGQGLVEYALLLVLIAIVVFLSLYFLGVSINDLWENTVIPLCQVFSPDLCP